MIVRVELSTKSGCTVCKTPLFGTLVDVFVFNVMWSELLVTYTISCPMWESVYEYQRVECAFTSLVIEDRVWYVCDEVRRLVGKWVGYCKRGADPLRGPCKLGSITQN